MGIGDWGLGIGDWGLGIGDWAQSPIPNPQSPIPNPHFFQNFTNYLIKIIIFYINLFSYIKYEKYLYKKNHQIFYGE